MAFYHDRSLSREEKVQLAREVLSGKRGTSWTDEDREAFRAGRVGSTLERKAFEATQAKIRAQQGRAPTLLTDERTLLNKQSLLG
jgi:hypothetical protein